MNENNKAYFAVIPANVRYDNDLSPNAKLLYAEITSLCNEKGYCWATNDYFSKLYNVSKKSVSLWVKQLIEKKYIISEIIYGDNKEIINRYLHICNDPMEKNFHTPMEKKVIDNNKYINKENINTKVFIKESEKKGNFTKPKKEEIIDYCKTNNFYNVDADDFIDYYESKGWKVGNVPMKDWKATVRRWNRKNIENKVVNNKPKFERNII